MAKQLIIAQFDEYGAAHRAFCELLQSGVQADDMTLLAGDPSNRNGAPDHLGLFDEDAEYYRATVRRGVSLLAVRADRARGARVAEIIRDHAPREIEDETTVGRRPNKSRTMSGAQADRPPSPGEFGEDAAGSVIERDADLVDAVAPDRDVRPRRR